MKTVLKNKKQKGFTIIELMFAIALLGFILIFTLTVISQLISTYNRGLSLIQINQAIRQLDNDMSKALKYVGPNNVTINFFTKPDGKITDDPNDPNIIAGSLCAKDATYVWNLGNEVYDDGKPFFRYTNSTTPLRLLRINTNEEKYCNGEDAGRLFVRGGSATSGGGPLDVTSLLGSQSMVLYVNVNKELGKSATETSKNQKDRLLRVHFVLSSAGQDFTPMWVDKDGQEKPENAPMDHSLYHLTCVNTKNKSEFCSFGEFSSIIYMRGQ